MELGGGGIIRTENYLCVLGITSKFRVNVCSQRLWSQKGAHAADPRFQRDLVYRFEKIIRNPNLSDLFKRIVNRLKK